jgi:hypothetical protein
MIDEEAIRCRWSMVGSSRLLKKSAEKLLVFLLLA